MKGVVVAGIGSAGSGRRGGRLDMVVRGGALVSAVVAAALLLSLGSRPSNVIDWWRSVGSMGGASPEASLLAIGRLAVLVLVSWLVGSGVVYAGARLTRRAALIRTVGWFTLPAVRRIAERCVAIILTLATVAGGGGRVAVAGSAPGAGVPTGLAATGVTAVTQASSTLDEAGLNPPVYLPTPAGDIEAIPDPSPTVLPWGGEIPPGPIMGPRNPALPPIGIVPEPALAPAPEVGATGQAAADRQEYVVVAGDNLWVIAERHLETALGRTPTDPGTATYWVHVIRVNRERLRSGDPDLIYPGEMVVCPPVAEVTPELVSEDGTP